MFLFVHFNIFAGIDVEKNVTVVEGGEAEVDKAGLPSPYYPIFLPIDQDFKAEMKIRVHIDRIRIRPFKNSRSGFNSSAKNTVIRKQPYR